MGRRSEMALGAPPPASGVDILGALRQAAITGLITFGLLLPLIGFNTVQNIRNEIVLETRWPLLAALVAIIAAGRFLHAILIAPWLARRAQRQRRGDGGGPAPRARGARRGGPVAAGFAARPSALALAAAGTPGAGGWGGEF